MVMVLNQRKVDEDEVKGRGRGQIVKALARSIDFIIIEIRRHCRVLSMGYDQSYAEIEKGSSLGRCCASNKCMIYR